MMELQGLSVHLHERLTSIHRLLDLSSTRLPRDRVLKLAQDLWAVDRLLDQVETCVIQQKDHVQKLQKFEESFEKDLVDLQNLKDSIPAYMPQKKDHGDETLLKQTHAPGEAPPPEKLKQNRNSFVKEMAFITTEEFHLIPQYMKGRVSYEQVNAVVRCMNSAASAKYRILHQSAKSLNSQSRRLKQRFREQETRDTRGQWFVVDQDILDLTQSKVDKRFQAVVNMLRHCRRLRELRGGGVTRYVVS